MMGGKSPKAKTGNGVPGSLMGGPKMHGDSHTDPVDAKKAKAKPKKDPKKNALNEQFDYVQSKFPNKIVERSKQEFGSYQISPTKSSPGGSFRYTPGKRVKKLSSDKQL